MCSVLLRLQEARERLRQQAYESVSAARSRIRRSASESIAEAQARIAAEDAAALADVHKVGSGFAACVCFVERGGGARPVVRGLGEGHVSPRVLPSAPQRHGST